MPQRYSRGTVKVRGKATLTVLLLCSLFFSTFGSGVGAFAQAANTASTNPLGVVQAAKPKSVADPNSVTIAGDFQHLVSGCTGDFQPNCAATHMTKSAIDGVWRYSVTIATAGNYSYKAVIDDDWSNGNFGLHAESGGANIPIVVPAGGATVKFYYDPKSHWVTDNINSVIVTAAGSFQNEIGCPADPPTSSAGDWDPGCLKSWMEDIQGTGTYIYQTPVGIQQTDADTPVTHFDFKAATGESWSNPNYPNSDVPFDITSDKQYAFLSYTPSNGNAVTASIKSTLPSQDNNVQYDGLGHDSRSGTYRVPFGAVNPNTPVTLRFRTFHNDVTSVTIRLYDTSNNSETRQPMTLVAPNVSCFDAGLTTQGYTCDFWQYTYTPTALGIVYYRFIIKDGTSTAYYADTANRYDGVGVPTPDEQDNGFRLNVVDPAFQIIPWMQNGVMYQIFPDRFRNGDISNDPKPTDFRYNYPTPQDGNPQTAANDQIQNRKWNQLPEGYCRAYAGPATTCNEAARGRDYFGGDLKGVDDKLDYLKNLGITVIYFNPIFDSGSNHGYDTRDYLKISPYFGTNTYFQNNLVPDAKAKGIDIVLDGVFNHLSSDSPFFDRYHHYTIVGACEGTSSLYRSWFVFTDVGVGTGQCADSQDRPNSATYVGWAGFDSIPQIQKADLNNSSQVYAPVANYFYSDPNTSVTNYWLKGGIRGWRFDVMTDPSFPTAYWQQLRTITKGIKPDEILIAEAWHWYDNLPLTHGDQADTAMGYRFRNAVFGLLGAVDDKGFNEEKNPNLPPSTFQKRMESMREDYANATYYTFQTLLDSHDTPRLLWSLTPPNDGSNVHSNREQKEFNTANVAIGKGRQDLAALVQMTTPGTPTVYYGDEVSLTGDDDPDDRRVFPWNIDANGNYINTNDTTYYDAVGDHATFDWYKKMAGIRAANPVLRNGKLTFLLTDDANKTLSYAMKNSNNQLVIVVMNTDTTNTRLVTVPTAGYVRDGLNFVDAVAGGNANTTAGKLSAVTLAPLGAAIYVLNNGQVINGPSAPANLTAVAGNGPLHVTLNWSAVATATNYNVYRSPVQGGGYSRIVTGNVSTNYTDTNVTSGSTYYYVVTAVDALGNESAYSNEANATPALPIGYAVIQFPKTISHVITATPDTVYGQVYIGGLTDAGGDPSAVIAQIGFGISGTNYTTWNFQPMTYNVKSGNNFEYQGKIRADTPGVYQYLVRFSDDGGLTFTYGDQNGIGTGTPGVMTITASSDNTPPTAPAPVSIDYNATSLTVKWGASTDDVGIAEYRVYRGLTAGGENPTPVAIVASNVLSYTDTSVSNGQTYYYYVRAYDTSLNPSPNSAEVSHIVTAKIVQTTFKVKVPAFTPPADKVYVTGQMGNGGNGDPLCGYCGGNASTVMTQVSPGIWQITLPIPEGSPVQYKYTRGTYDYVEEWGSIAGFTNRVATVTANSGADLTRLFDDTSDSINDDNHKAVQNWRDALVKTVSPLNGASVAASISVTVTFNWDVKPETVDFSNGIVLQLGAAQISGTVTHNAANQSLTFVPTTALAAGTYTVTVDHVVAVTQSNDGNKIRTPYTFSFVVVSASPAPQLSVAPMQLNFTAQTGGSNPASQPVTLTASNGPITYTTSVSGALSVTVSPAAGTVVSGGNSPVTISVNATGLAAGTYTATVTFQDTTNPADKATVNVTLIVTAAPPTVYTYYLPFLANGYNPGAPITGTFTSYLAVENAGSGTANATISYFDSTGVTLTSSTVVTTIAQYGEILPANPFASGAKGAGVITSNQPLNVIVAEGTPYGGSAYAVNQGANSSLIVPLAINNNNNFVTQITVFNGGTVTTTATLTYYDQSGASPTNQVLTVGPRQSATADQTNVTGLASGFYGWAAISSTVGSQLVAQVLEQRPDIKFVAIANAQPAPQTTLYAPAIFNNAYGGFFTGANIVNPASTPVTVSISYYDQGGTRFAATPFVLVGRGVQQVFQGSATGNGIPAGGLPANFVGAAVITSTGGGVNMVVNEVKPVLTGSQSGVYAAASSGSSNLGLPVIAKNGFGYTTGTTVFNASPISATFTLTYYKLDGTALTTPAPRNITVAAHASVGVYQGDDLPSDFYGTAVLVQTSGGSTLIDTTNAINGGAGLFYTYTEPAQ